jgi:hypothetical protein
VQPRWWVPMATAKITGVRKQSSLNRQQVTNPLACPKCDKIFSREEKVKRHSLICRGGDGQFISRHQKYHRKRARRLTARITGPLERAYCLIRGSEKELWPCPDCSKGFSRPDHVRRHLLEFHRAKNCCVSETDGGAKAKVYIYNQTNTSRDRR